MSRLDDALDLIRATRPRNTVVFSGSGISADSGVPVFRGPGGLWRNHRPEDLATPEAFRREPRLVWEWYEWRRGIIREARPNAAHEAIARLGATVVTQNVDGLHARAGSDPVLELHGNIFRVRCVREGKEWTHVPAFDDVPPHCECGALLRPCVVWFGEMLPEDVVARAVSAIRRADLLIVAGTSGVVYPAAGFVNLHRGTSIEVNPETSALSTSCTVAVAETAVAAIPILVSALLENES